MRPLLIAASLLTGALLSVSVLRPAAGGLLDAPLPAAEFTHAAESDWINSAPLTLADLRGSVVLLDFWTFDCWNCYRSIPWLKEIEARFATDGLRVIGVHTPEFDHEKVRANVAAKVREFGVKHPVMLDNDFSYWRAMGNRFWPAFYLLDRGGNIRAVFYGETHAGDRQAQAIDAAITALLAEDVEEPVVGRR
jgi:thiol-disulfide isomerase/thioredoxin